MRSLQVFARLLLAVWLAVAPVKVFAGSSMLLTGVGGASGPSAASLTYIGPIQTESSGGTSISYPSTPFGTANANRVLVAVFGARIVVSNSISSATIGGISATHAGSTLSQNGAVLSDIWYASVPTGTSGTVSVTYSAATVATGVQLYSVVTTTPTPSSTSSATATTGTSLSLASPITVSANGVGIVGGAIQTPSSPALTNASLDNNGTISGGRGLTVGNLAVGSITPGITNGTFTGLSFSAASWGP